ncbi:hypothetical protein F5Y16DRAFT_363501 [Xylariaceae sp. FL0255]|nr:hypothetical protein F5Y16DRAFT_363501 [Xylariaceae sp. FL0255]
MDHPFQNMMNDLEAVATAGDQQQINNVAGATNSTLTSESTSPSALIAAASTLAPDTPGPVESHSTSANLPHGDTFHSKDVADDAKCAAGSAFAKTAEAKDDKLYYIPAYARPETIGVGWGEWDQWVGKWVSRKMLKTKLEDWKKDELHTTTVFEADPDNPPMPPGFQIPAFFAVGPVTAGPDGQFPFDGTHAEAPMTIHEYLDKLNKETIHTASDNDSDNDNDNDNDNDRSATDSS